MTNSMVAAISVLMKHLENRAVEETGNRNHFFPVPSCSFVALIDDEWISQSAFNGSYFIPSQSVRLYDR